MTTEELQDIDLGGLGEFGEEPGAFVVHRHYLEEPWGYIYCTPHLLLRVDQRGPVYAQFEPPAGTVFFRRERFQEIPSFFLLFRTAPGQAFSSFWAPEIGGQAPREPEEFECEYRPEKATYRVVSDGLESVTELSVADDQPVVLCACTIRNRCDEPREIEVIPVLRPHLAAGSLAPWDVPSLYQRVSYSNETLQAFEMELRSPAGTAEDRRHAFVLCDIESPESAEVSYERFVGRGSLERPESAFMDSPGIDARRQTPWGDQSAAVSVNGKQGIVALRKRVVLGPGEHYSLNLVLGAARRGLRGKRPPADEVHQFSRYFEKAYRRQSQERSLGRMARLMNARRVWTPDPALDRYVNEFLPLQLSWVSTLDRGWPTGLRGVRDFAQDSTAMAPLDPESASRAIVDLFSVQRSDGWFPRQFRIGDHSGPHDLRAYVDGGVWVWELLFDYLCRTGDIDLLRERAPWMNDDEDTPILLHAVQLIAYYLDPGNRGEHGLCLIREGDWNDSVNRAGLEGHGESVMVSCQVVGMLRQAAHLLSHPLVAPNLESDARSLTEAYLREAKQLQQAILRHALNAEGYLNGVFTDLGEWVFSPDDPDGQQRVNVPVNAFGIVSGVLEGEQADRALKLLKEMRQRDGWPLFWPPIGNPPIEGLGRIGAGDLAPGLGENGTMYNHGCHGFLGRAAATAADGGLLLEVLRCLLPYDQDCHPVERSKTAPYAVVNCYRTAPGLEGRGGDAFLTGSISTGLRAVYDGIFGIRPLLDGLLLLPALPPDWPECSAAFSFQGRQIELKYVLQDGRGFLRVNGDSCSERREDPLSGRAGWFVSREVLKADAPNSIVCYPG